MKTIVVFGDSECAFVCGVQSIKELPPAGINFDFGDFKKFIKSKKIREILIRNDYIIGRWIGIFVSSQGIGIDADHLRLKPQAK